MCSIEISIMHDSAISKTKLTEPSSRVLQSIGIESGGRNDCTRSMEVMCVTKTPREGAVTKCETVEFNVTVMDVE